eukprot:gene14388-16526_t
MKASLNVAIYATLHANTVAILGSTVVGVQSCNVRSVQSITASDAAATVLIPLRKALTMRNVAGATIAM